MTRPRLSDLEDSGQICSLVYAKLPDRLVIVHAHRTLDEHGLNARSRGSARALSSPRITT